MILLIQIGIVLFVLFIMILIIGFCVIFGDGSLSHDSSGVASYSSFHISIDKQDERSNLWDKFIRKTYN